MDLSSPHAFTKGDRLYVVGAVKSVSPANPLEEFALGASIVDDAKRRAPNEYFGWLSGHYMSADRPNRNGAMWRSQDVALKKLTPVMSPLTVMHLPDQVVGTIADSQLIEAKDGETASLDTALAVWKHRFPEVWEEVEHNEKAGTLWQSLECLSKSQEVIAGMDGEPDIRIQLDPVFTGSGLIFGSRGALPGDPDASIESLQSEVAELHERHRHQQRPGRSPSPKPGGRKMEIEDTEYARLIAQDEKAKRVERLETELAEANDAKAAAEKAQEAAEAAKIAAEKLAADEKAKADAAEEKARQEEMSSDRLSKLGGAVLAKVSDTLKARIETQAKSMPDAEWAERVTELEELTGAKAGETADLEADDTFTDLEVASFQGGHQTGGASKEPTPRERASVVGALFN